MPTVHHMGPYRWVNTAPLQPGESRTSQFDRFTFPGASVVVTFWPDPDQDFNGFLTTERITARVDKTGATQKNAVDVTYKCSGGDTLRSWYAYITVVVP
jgi:hypothetical protein